MIASGRGKRGKDREPRRTYKERYQGSTLHGMPSSMGPKRYARYLEEKAAAAALIEDDQRLNELGRQEREMTPEERRRTVPERLDQILRQYFGFRYMPFHLEALRLMFEGGYHVINWPTDHAKSWMALYFFPILSLMENPNESHIVCGASLLESRRRVEMIQRELTTNKALLEMYPWIAQPALDVKQSWSRTELTVAGRTVSRPDPSVVAESWSSSTVRTRRGKLLMDDTEGPKHRRSRSERERLYDFVKLDALRNYEDKQESSRPLLLAAGTPFDVDSIYFRLEGEDWQVHRRPVYTDPAPWSSTNPENHRDALLWPDKFDKVLMQWHKMTKAQFAIAYLMDPTIGNPSRLTLEQIRSLLANATPQTPTLTFISIDPATGSGNRQADYCGISVVGINWPPEQKYPRVSLLECFRIDHPQGYIEHIDLISELSFKYPQAKVIVEGNASQAGTYRNGFQHHAPHLLEKTIWFYTTESNKFDEEMGLTAIRRLVREECLWVPRSLLESEGVRNLMEEIRDLGAAGVHDHISASIWFAVRWVYDQVRQYSGPQVVWGWNTTMRGRQDYVDREGALAAPAAVNGWAPTIGQYRRWKS